jgi:translocation and assembly module TamB
MKRLFHIIGWLLVGISLLIGGTFMYLQSPTGQDFLTKEVVSYLRKKLNTKVEVDKVRFHIPDWISLENVYIQDLQQDTLVLGKKIYADIDMMALLNDKVAINKIELEGIRLKVNRTLPDTSYNFNFILKAFDSGEPTPSNSKGFTIGINNIKLQNVNISYKDAILGTDADANFKFLETNFDKFDLDKSQYHFRNINADNSTVILKLYPALATQKTNPAPKEAATPLDFNLKRLNLSNITWLFESAEDGIKNGGKFTKLEAEGDKFDLANQSISLKKILLENPETFVKFEKKSAKKIAQKPETITPTDSTGWSINVAQTQLKNSKIAYDDFNALAQTKGLDASHLGISNFNLDLKNFVFSTKIIAGQLKSSNFNEKSGLTVKNLSTDFSYTDKSVMLKKLLIQTPKTLLQDEVVMQYNSVEDFSKNLGNVGVKLNLKKSQLAISDLLILMPDLAKNPTFKDKTNEIIKADGVISGRVNNLVVSKLLIDGFGESHLDLKGRITGLPNTEKMGVDMQIGQVRVSKQDILRLAGDSTIPKSIELPEYLSLKGAIKGKLQDLDIDAALDSDFGGGAFKGTLKNITADQNQTYDGQIVLNDFDVGKLTKQPETVGKLTLNAKIVGSGLDPKTMNTSIEGIAAKAQIKGYEYSNLALNGTIKDQIANFKASVNDANAKVLVNTRVNLADEFPAIEAIVNIDELDLKKLNLYADDLSLKGDIEMKMISTNPDNPLGRILINKAIVRKDGRTIPLDKVDLDIKNSSNGRDITLKSPFLNAQIDGKFVYTQLSDIILTEVNKYFSLPNIAYKPVLTPYDLQISAKLNNHPIIQSFVAGISKLDTINFSANINNQQDTTLKASLFVPYVEYDTSSVSNTRFKIFGTGSKAEYEGNVAQILFSDYRFRRIFVGGDISNNVLSLALQAKDSLNVNRYGFAGNLRSIDKKFRLNFNNKGTLIDYRTWTADSTGFIEYGSKGVYIQDFSLTQNRQKISINSKTSEPNSLLNIKIDSLNIKPFVTLTVQDSTLADGTLNGLFQLTDYMNAPEFTGDLTIKNFILTQIPIGDLSLNATNETKNQINVLASILSANNDIRLDGKYLSNQKNPLDFKIDVKKIGAKTVEAFSFGQLKNARGNLNGLLSLKGQPSKPIIDGNIRFDTVSFSLAMLGSTYRIQNQAFNFKNSIINFNKFVIADTLGQNMNVNGTLSLQNIPDFSYKLNIGTKNFMVLNGSRKDNDFFYGKGFVDANLNVKGIGTKPAIEGTVKVRERSDITVLLPDREIDKAETDGIVEFVNLKNPAANATQVDSSQITNTVDFVEEVSLNIEVDDKSQLTIVVDELNGDNIKVKGNAQLNTGITPSGQPYVLGLYELTSGSYDLSFQFLKKEFAIKKGSSLLWTGDPMQAQVNITAVYQLDATIPKSESLGKLPLNVLLEMTGNISSPVISFKVVVDKDKASEDIVSKFNESGSYLKDLENNPVEMNKQVFALLVLNKFLGEQSTDFFSGINPEAIARQSASKLLTDQLNLLAGDLIKGIKLDFNLNSTASNTDGVSKARTDLNVGLSKAFLNDRLKVAVGRNFQLENTNATAATSTEIVDNISLNYSLSKDGRYLFSAYRKNQYQAILDGFVVETGVAFSVTLDYEYFKEFFERKK